MSNKYFGGVVTNTGVAEDVDADLKATVLGTLTKTTEKMDQLRVQMPDRDLRTVQTLQQIY